ncbi:hypothetical protein YB2330_004969 [Saitoella coloradoensis]
MRSLTFFAAVLVSSFAGDVVAASPAFQHQPRGFNGTSVHHFVNGSGGSGSVAPVRQHTVGSFALVTPGAVAVNVNDAASSEMVIPVIVHAETQSYPTPAVAVAVTPTTEQNVDIDTCPASTFTYGQLITDPAQIITSATTTYILASSTCAAGSLSYYIQTSSAVAALPYSELVAPTHTLTVTEFVDEVLVGTGVWEVTPSAVTILETTTQAPAAGGGLVAYATEKTVEVTETVVVGAPRTTTITSVITVSSMEETGSVSTVEVVETVTVGGVVVTTTVTSVVTVTPTPEPTGWEWFEGADVEGLCAELVGTATEDVTTTETSTTFVQNFVTSTFDLFNTTTYPVALNQTAAALSTSTNVVPAYSIVNSSSIYNVSVPSTVQTVTTSTFLDLSSFTETPTTTTTEAVPTTSNTVTSATVTVTTLQPAVTPLKRKRHGDVAELFDAASEKDRQGLIRACVAKFGQSTVALTHTATEVQSVLEKDGTVISTRTSMISAPTLVPTFIATTTSTVPEQVTSTSLITSVIPVPAMLTYIDGTSTMISVTTMLSTTTFTAPAVVITESTPTVVATNTQTALFTTTVYSTCIANGAPCESMERPDLCCGQACLSLRGSTPQLEARGTSITWSPSPTPVTTIYVKRELSLEDEFEAAVEGDAQSVSSACLANFDMPTITVSKEILAVETIVEKDGTVIATHVSVASTPVYITIIVATATSQVIDTLNQTITSSYTQSIPTSVTYIASTATDIDVWTLNSTVRTTLPAATISEFSTFTTTTTSSVIATATYSICPLPESQRRSNVANAFNGMGASGSAWTSTQAQSYDDCCIACLSMENCNGFAFYDTDYTKACYLAPNGRGVCMADAITWVFGSDTYTGGVAC